MPRSFALVAALMLGATSGVAGQAAVRMSIDSATQSPSVQVLGLLNEPRWQEALDNAFVVRLTWQIELWKDRAVFDQKVDDVKFDIVIQRAPLLGLYSYTIFQGGHPPADGPPYTELESFALQVARPIDISNFGPKTSGTYYYSATLKVSAIDDQEFAEMRRFMGSGENGSLLDAIRGRILKWVGIPSQTLTMRSLRFEKR